MKTLYRAALAGAAVFCLFPLSARAEIKERSFEVSPFIGYNIFENSQNLKDRPEFGGRLGYNFTKHLGMEGTLEFIHSRVQDKSQTGAREGQYGRPIDGVNLTYYHIDAVYHFMPEGKFNPFVVAGIGGSHSSPEISNHDMAAFNFGVGAKYWVADRIAIRADLRDYFVTEIFQESYRNVAATVGLTFAFGGNPAPAPAPVAKVEPAQCPPIPAPVPCPAQVQCPQVPAPVPCPSCPPQAPCPAPAPCPACPPPPAPIVIEKIIVPEPKIINLSFQDIHFDFDKSTLTPEAKTTLKRNIEILKKNPKAEIRIEGFTSASGTEDYNQQLSERRANAIKEYLVSEGGIASDRLATVGYGKTNPAVHETSPSDINSPAAKANMRALFEITVK